MRWIKEEAWKWMLAGIFALGFVLPALAGITYLVGRSIIELVQAAL